MIFVDYICFLEYRF